MKRRPRHTGPVVAAIVAVLTITGVRASHAASDLASVEAGNAMATERDRDSNGMSSLRGSRRRSPSGFLYPFPWEVPPYRHLGEDEAGADVRAFAELGWLENAGDEDEARFSKYADTSDGVLLRRFSLDARERGGAGYLELGGGSVGRDDQFYHLEAGIFGLVRVRSEYDSLRHVYADDARVLHLEDGQESLVLPPGLTPGMNTQTAIANALSSVGESRLYQDVDHSRTTVSLRLLPELTLSGEYQLRRRDGRRPFGGTLGLTLGNANRGSLVETLAPLHSRTHDWSAGLAWQTPRLQTRLTYRGSIYDNRRDSLTWENPFGAVDTGAGATQGPERGRSALAPDNQLHQIHGDVGITLPMRGQLAASAAWTTMRQDARLLPATIDPSITAFSTLSRERADARVDQLTIRTSLRLRPLRPLGLRLRFDYRERDNRTDYFALDPTTGQYGYVFEDVGLRQRVGAVPFDRSRWTAEGQAEWRLLRHTRVGAGYEHERTEREHRSRKRLDDQRVALWLASRSLERATLRLGYDYGRRGGSAYDPSRDLRYYVPNPGSTALAGPARSLAEFRQVDLASHERHEVQLRGQWLASEDLDASLTARYRTTDYRVDYGVTDEQTTELTAETRYQLSPAFAAHAFASFEWRERKMATIDSQGGPPSPDLGAGGTVFPLANAWRQTSDARSVAVGAGLEARPAERLTLEADYRYLRTQELVDTAFDRTGGALAPPTDPATARSKFPELLVSDHVLELSARYRWSDAIESALAYRLFHSTIDDYHQNGLVPLVNQNLYLAGIDDDFTAHLIGITARLRF